MLLLAELKPCFAQGRPPAAQLTGAALIEGKLDIIKFPMIAYDGLTMTEVVTDLVRSAKRHDPERKGVNVLLKPGISQVLVKLKLPLFELSLKQSLDVIVRTSEAPIRYVVDNQAIVFEADDDTRATAKTSGQKAAAIRKKLEHIKIPVVHYPRLVLDDVIKDIRHQIREHGINFVLAPTRRQPGANPPPVAAPILDAFGNPVVTPGGAIRLRSRRGPELGMVITDIDPAVQNATVKETLDAVARTASRPIRYTVEDYGVVFEMRSAPSKSGSSGALK